jgi:nitroreductase
VDHAFAGRQQQNFMTKVMNMLTTKEAIEQRCCIKKFKTEPIPEDCLDALLDAARSAGSDTNTQPCRFKIVKDKETKFELAVAAYGQPFIVEAPVVLVCCADTGASAGKGFPEIEPVGEISTVENQIMELILKKKNGRKAPDKKLQDVETNFSVAIAVEHIVLRALDFGLGCCCVRVVDEQKIRELFRWDSRLAVVALLSIGYPAESPSPGGRSRFDDIILQ